MQNGVKTYRAPGVPASRFGPTKTWLALLWCCVKAFIAVRYLNTAFHQSYFYLCQIVFKYLSPLHCLKHDLSLPVFHFMDSLSKEKRSAVMRSIKAKNTKPELILRSALHLMGYRYRIHDRKLPGTPDIVFKKFKTVIFVNGCFWHGHDACRPGIFVPKTNTSFWQKKRIDNQIRDKTKIMALQKMGWRVIVVYECELKKKKLQSTVSQISMALKMLNE